MKLHMLLIPLKGRVTRITITKKTQLLGQVIGFIIHVIET